MKVRGAILYCVALIVAWSCIASAHHSFAGIYDQARSVTLNGVVREFQFVHPHPFLIIDVMGDGDDVNSWRAEMDNRFELEDIGITSQTFRPGDRVLASGSPGRTQPHTLYLWRLDRPADGLHYEQVGGTPSIRIPPRR